MIEKTFKSQYPIAQWIGGLAGRLKNQMSKLASERPCFG